MISAKNISLFLPFLLWIHPGFSQTLKDTLYIEEVSVYRYESPPGRPLAETVIDTLTMQQAVHNDLSQLLANHSTVFIKSTGDGLLATASFRGTDPGHTKVFWNGIRLNSPMLGQVDLSMVPVCFADKITLLHGSSSLTETSGALGGTISLDGVPDWDGKTLLGINLEAGSFHSYHTTAELNLRSGNLLASTKLFYHRAQNNFSFKNTAVLPVEETELKNAGYVKYGVNQDVFWRPDSHNQVSLHCWIQTAERDIPQPMSYEGDDRIENQLDDQAIAVVKWKHYGERSTMEIGSGISLAKGNYLFSFLESGYVNIDSRSREAGVYNHVTFDHYLNNKTTLTARISQSSHRVNIKELIRSQGYTATRTELSGMIMANRQVTDRLAGWLLIREDLVDAGLLPVMPSAGWSYKLLKNKELYLKSTLSRNHNFPTLNDLYWIPGGNPGLKPETGYSAELSASVQHRNGNYMLTGELTGFASWIKDWILWSPTRFQYWTAENIERVFSRGMESTARIAMEGYKYKVSMDANYRMTFTTDRQVALAADRSVGKQLIYIPRHFMNANGYFNYRGYYMNYSFRLVGRRFTQSSNDERTVDAVLNTYSLSNVLVGKEITIWRVKTTIQVGIYNLFNETYQVILARPMPGRFYMINLAAEI